MRQTFVILFFLIALKVVSYSQTTDYGYSIIVEQQKKIYVSSFKFCDAARDVIYEYDYKSSNADMPFFSVGDFLSNGKTQILLCGRSWNGEDYYFFGFLGIEQ